MSFKLVGLALSRIPWEATGAVVQDGNTDRRLRKTVFVESSALLVDKALAPGLGMENGLYRVTSFLKATF